MRDMFFYYDNNVMVPQEHEPRPFCPTGPTSKENTAFIYNINGKPIGVEIRNGMPFTLYFNLKSNQSLPELLQACDVVLELYTISHKRLLEKTFKFLDQFNYLSSDLIVYFDQTDISKLSAETYRIKLYLKHEDETYILYDESDGLLILR